MQWAWGTRESSVGLPQTQTSVLRHQLALPHSPWEALGSGHLLTLVCSHCTPCPASWHPSSRHCL